MPTTRTRVMDQSTDRSTMNSTASQLALKMDFTNPGLAVLHVSGALDTATAPRLAHVLWPRLASTLSVLTIDLRQVTFLDAAGLEVLASAHNWATHHDKFLSIVAEPNPTIDRALWAGGLTDIPRYQSIEAAEAASARQMPAVPTRRLPAD